MRRIVLLFAIASFSFLLVCCKKDPVIQVDDVREIDFLNKTGDVIEGQFVGEILGARTITAYDSLLFVVTNNPDGMLQIFSFNDLHNKLGSFCKRGRARNEMSQITSLCQSYKKDGHIYLFMIDGGVRICEMDVTASLEQGVTLITRTKMRPMYKLGADLFINNDIDYVLDFIEDFRVGDEKKQKKAPSKYTLYKDDKQNNLAFFKSAMEVDEHSLAIFPYRGTIVKHPSKNLVVNKFFYMDYLLFMDFDNNHFFAVHQKGSITHNDIYYREDPWIQHFSACTESENYFFVFYRNGKYSQIQQEGDVYYPELLVFDWEGNYLKGFKMDRQSDSMVYDDKHKKLYTLRSRTEQLYCYDLSSYLP